MSEHLNWGSNRVLLMTEMPAVAMKATPSWLKVGDDTELLICKSANYCHAGLWSLCIEGGTADGAVNFFIGSLMGMALVAVKAEHDGLAEAEAEYQALPEHLKVKARRMVKSYNSAMADAEKTIKGKCRLEDTFEKGQTEQLSLDLKMDHEVWF